MPKGLNNPKTKEDKNTANVCRLNLCKVCKAIYNLSEDDYDVLLEMSKSLRYVCNMTRTFLLSYILFNLTSEQVKLTEKILESKLDSDENKRKIKRTLEKLEIEH